MEETNCQTTSTILPSIYPLKLYKLEEVRKLIKSFHNKLIINHDFQLFKSLLINHPTWKDKLDEIEAVRVITGKFNKNLLLQIKPNWCKKFITISWRKCQSHKISKYPQHTIQAIIPTQLPLILPAIILAEKHENYVPNLINASLTGAMRYSIRKQITNFKKNNNQFIFKKCTVCHKTTNLQVDHIIAFSQLQKNFLHNIDPLSIPIQFHYNHKTCQPKFKKEHLGFNRRWQFYHQKHANFQWLCRSCNIKKSNK